MSRVVEMSGNFSLKRPRMAGRMYSPGMVLPPTTSSPLIRPWNASSAWRASRASASMRVAYESSSWPARVTPGAAPEPVEQAHAELVLEGADVLGHRGLGEVQRLGGAGEGAELGDLGEDLELTEIHGGSSIRSDAEPVQPAPAARSAEQGLGRLHEAFRRASDARGWSRPRPRRGARSRPRARPPRSARPRPAPRAPRR